MFLEKWWLKINLSKYLNLPLEIMMREITGLAYFKDTWNKRVFLNMLWNNDIFKVYFKYILKYFKLVIYM
jgi:hypothetical protein